MTSRSILLNKRRQSEKATYYMISTAQQFLKRQNYGYKSWSLGVWGREDRMNRWNITGVMILSLLGLLTLT